MKKIAEKIADRENRRARATEISEQVRSALLYTARSHYSALFALFEDARKAKLIFKFFINLFFSLDKML